MSLLDIAIPSKRIVIKQSFDDKPEVALDVFGLTTNDFAIIADKYARVLAALFFKNAKEDLADSENTMMMLREFPGMGALCIACGCKQPAAAEYVESMPLLVQVELLSTVFALTFPEGLKKSLEKLAPTIVQLLNK